MSVLLDHCPGEESETEQAQRVVSHAREQYRNVLNEKKTGTAPAVRTEAIDSNGVVQILLMIMAHSSLQLQPTIEDGQQRILDVMSPILQQFQMLQAEIWGTVIHREEG